MSNDQLLYELRVVLADLYKSEADQRRLVSDAGLSQAFIVFNDTPINVCYNILSQAQNHSKLSAIITIALSTFPDYPKLIAVVQRLRKVIIPILIGAMTHDEATALFNKTVFNDVYDPSDKSKLTEEFQNFLGAVTPKELENFQKCYHDERENWCPSYSETVPIKEIINETLTCLNGEELRFVPEFVSASFFSNDEKVRRKIIDELDASGGVLVIDAISMYHPWLNKRINEAYSIHKHVTVLIISPVDVYTQPINKCVERIFEDRMVRAYERFNEKYDHLCEIDLGNLRSLKRWFFRTIPETVRFLHQKAPLQSNLDAMRQSQGNKPQMGINPVLFGAGGVS